MAPATEVDGQGHGDAPPVPVIAVKHDRASGDLSWAGASGSIANAAVILTVIPPGPTEPNQTALIRIDA
jgi:hypothetical protein